MGTWPGTQDTFRVPATTLTLKMCPQPATAAEPHSQAAHPATPEGAPCPEPQDFRTCHEPPSHTNAYQAGSAERQGSVSDLRGEATERPRKGSACFLPRSGYSPSPHPLQAEVHTPQQDPKHLQEPISPTLSASTTHPHAGQTTWNRGTPGPSVWVGLHKPLPPPGTSSQPLNSRSSTTSPRSHA